MSGLAAAIDWRALPVDQFLEIDGARVRYWNDGDGVPLLFVHGLGASVEAWLPNVVGLAPRLRTIAVDLPGFGRSERGAEHYSLRAGAAFLRKFADALGLDRISLAGNSMGGAICLRFALDYPDRVDRLILIGSAGLGRELSWSLRLLALPPLRWYFLRNAKPEWVEQGLRSCLFDPWSLSPEYVRACISACGHRQTFVSSSEAIGAGVALWGQRAGIRMVDRLGEIQAPTLIIWGRQDVVIPFEHGVRAADRLPNAKLALIEKCGHCPQLEHPDCVNRLIEQFLTP